MQRPLNIALNIKIANLENYGEKIKSRNANMYTFKRAGFRKGRKILLRDTIIAVWSTSFTSRYKDFLRTRATVSNSMLGRKFWLVLQKTPALEQGYTLQGYNYASGNTTFAAFNSDLKISLWVWARVRLSKFLANRIPRIIACRRFWETCYNSMALAHHFGSK